MIVAVAYCVWGRRREGVSVFMINCSVRVLVQCCFVSSNVGNRNTTINGFFLVSGKILNKLLLLLIILFHWMFLLTMSSEHLCSIFLDFSPSLFALVMATTPCYYKGWRILYHSVSVSVVTQIIILKIKDYIGRVCKLTGWLLIIP